MKVILEIAEAPSNDCLKRKSLIGLEMLGNLGVNFEVFSIYSCYYGELWYLLLQIVTLVMAEVHLQDNLEMILQENNQLTLSRECC